MAIVVALVVCFVAIPLAAVAVDLGVQRVARRDMQSLADMAAMDLARQLDGRAKSAYVMSNLTAAAKDSVTRNSSTVGSAPVLAIKLGTTDPAKYGTSGYFTESASSGIPTAVQVTASTEVNFSLMGGTGGATRTAVAMSKSETCFKLGSYAVGLDASNGPLLNALVAQALGGSAALKAIGYGGLAGGSVSALGLMTELGLVDPEKVADASVKLKDLSLAAAKALAKEGGSPVHIGILEAIAANVNANTVKLGDLIGLKAGGDAGLVGDLNLLDLIAGSAILSNGAAGVTVKDLAVGLPNVVDLKTSLTVIEKPREACGSVGVSAETAQVNLTLEGTLVNLPKVMAPLGLLGALVALDVSAKINLDFRLAPAKGTLRRIICGTGTTANPNGMDVGVQTALNTLVLHVPIALALGVLDLTTIDVGIQKPLPPKSELAEVRMPPHGPNKPFEGAGQPLGLTGVPVPTLTFSLLGIPFNADLLAPILTPVTAILIPAIDAALINPLSKLLGIKTQGVDVFPGRIPPTCNAAKLIG